jgi:muramoyltetrapeptide carboxypeptidase
VNRAARRPAILPPPLVRGDRIGIAAPAGPVRRDALESGVAYLEARGFGIVPGAHLHARHGYLAGSDEERLQDLRGLIADRTLKAIWLARGGYGSARIVEGLRLDALRARPKAIIGYSDATVLHAAFWIRIGLSTFYGPNVSDLGRPESFDEPSLWRCLTDGGAGPIEHSLDGAEVLRPGRARGVLLGGCLSLLVHLIGTPLQLPGPGAILFWEEVAEEPYRIDRMLGHLRQSGALERIRGMLVGQTTDCRAKVPGNDLPLAEILDRHLGGAKIPVVTGFPAGHGPGKVTLPLGRMAALDTGAGRLVISGR